MNLRILKKLSKRAVPLLKILDGRADVEHFVSSQLDGFGGCDITGIDRKHWQRSRAAHDQPVDGRRQVITQPRCRAGTRWPFIHARDPRTCWNGTPMVGWMSGYEVREWEELTAFGYLASLIHSSVSERRPLQDDEDDEYGLGYIRVRTVRLPNPAAYLRHARMMAAGQVTA